MAHSFWAYRVVGVLMHRTLEQQLDEHLLRVRVGVRVGVRVRV